MQEKRCAVCGTVIEPTPRYYLPTGQPVHMLCKDKRERELGIAVQRKI